MLKKRLNFSTVHSKTGLWALAFLAFFYFLILVPSQAICVRRLRDAGIHWSWSFEPWSGYALFVDGARYFPISLGDHSYFPLDSPWCSGKTPSPQSMETPWEWLEPQVTATGELWRQLVWAIPNFVAAPDLSDEKPPLNKNGCWTRNH